MGHTPITPAVLESKPTTNEVPYPPTIQGGVFSVWRGDTASVACASSDGWTLGNIQGNGSENNTKERKDTMVGRRLEGRVRGGGGGGQNLLNPV